MAAETRKWDKIVRLPHGNFTARIIGQSVEGNLLHIEYIYINDSAISFPLPKCWIQNNDIIGTVKPDED